MTRLRLPPVLLATSLLACATTPSAPPPPPAVQGPVVPSAEQMPLVEEPPRDPLAPPPDVGGVPPDAVVGRFGLASKLLRRGTGTQHPGTFSVVRVHYTGWTTDGRMFDSSVQRGEPAEFPLNGVISGWKHAVKAMVVGEKRRFWIPEELAYKDMPGPQGMLVFEIELLDIVQQ